LSWHLRMFSCSDPPATCRGEECVASLGSASQVYVYVPPAGTDRPLDTVYLAAESGTGRCFWIRSIGGEDHPRFATTDCGAPDLAAPALGLEFNETW